MIIPGTIKDNPQLWEANDPAITEPMMLPNDVWEFQIPMISPRLKAHNRIKCVVILQYFASD